MFKTTIAITVIALTIAAGSVQAQPQPGSGPGGSGGYGQGMGPGMGGGPGMAMMTPDERRAHFAKMRSFTTYGECHAYVEKHHRLMSERAKQRGVTLPAEPLVDHCLRLK